MYPKAGKTKRLQAAFSYVVAGMTLVMMSAFMGLMLGGGTVLIIVGMAWIITAGREAREATSRGVLGTQPRNVKEAMEARTCELCGAGVSWERTDPRCPLIEAYVCVRVASIKLDDWGVSVDGDDAGPGIDGLRQG